jgi:hypothetical protein
MGEQGAHRHAGPALTRAGRERLQVGEGVDAVAHKAVAADEQAPGVTGRVAEAIAPHAVTVLNNSN